MSRFQSEQIQSYIIGSARRNFVHQNHPSRLILQLYFLKYIRGRFETQYTVKRTGDSSIAPIGNESVPKIITNDTIIFFLKRCAVPKRDKP